MANLTAIVNDVRTFDPRDSARVLWDTVLTENERNIIQREQETYRRAVQLIGQSERFFSYHDPTFREFINRNHSHNQLTAGRNSLRAIIGVLIGDHERVPQQTRDALHDPAKPPIYIRMSHIEAEKTDLLRGYIADVATVFLMQDFPLSKTS